MPSTVSPLLADADADAAAGDRRRPWAWLMLLIRNHRRDRCSHTAASGDIHFYYCLLFCHHLCHHLCHHRPWAFRHGPNVVEHHRRRRHDDFSGTSCSCSCPRPCCCYRHWSCHDRRDFDCDCDFDCAIWIASSFDCCCCCTDPDRDRDRDLTNRGDADSRRLGHTHVCLAHDLDRGADRCCSDPRPGLGRDACTPDPSSTSRRHRRLQRSFAPRTRPDCGRRPSAPSAAPGPSARRRG